MKTTQTTLRSRWLVTIPCVVAMLFACQTFAGEPGQDAAHWYKGNTHGHTHWSDGDAMPESVVGWFKSHGYQFLAVSDHEVLMQGDQWKSIDSGKRPVSSASIECAKKQFGDDSVAIRGEGLNRQVKLKTFAELATKFNEPGKFLMIQNEEVATQVNGLSIHMNAINLAEDLTAQKGTDMADTIQLTALAIKKQAEQLHRPIIAQVNHPNYVAYDVSAEDLAQASAVKFFEVCNGHPSVRNSGDATHPSTDKLWDIANTIRIAKMKLPPLYGVGSDDSHNYHQFSPQHANPGRAWIMVHAKDLSAEAILDGMDRGDYYATTGVTLRNVAFDPKARVYQVEVQPEPGVKHTIEFIGTLEGTDTAYETIAPEANAKVQRPGRKYSPEVGKVLATVQGESGAYKLTGKELYVRAVIRSDKPMPNPINDDFTAQQAWCQPVGWETK